MATRTETGASTPVSVKIKRIEDKGKGGEAGEVSRRTMQPTVRSFMDLKSGLVGSQKRTGFNPGNQAQNGRDLSLGPIGTSGMFGEAWNGEKKDSRRTEDEGPDESEEKGGDLKARDLRGNMSLDGGSYLGGGEVQGKSEDKGKRGSQGKRRRE